MRTLLVSLFLAACSPAFAGECRYDGPNGDAITFTGEVDGDWQIITFTKGKDTVRCRYQAEDETGGTAICDGSPQEELGSSSPTDGPYEFDFRGEHFSRKTACP